MARIFISYSRADAQFINELVPLITKVFPNHNIWYDEHITGGEDWWQRILDEIDACDVFIYLLSNDSLASEYCQAEFREALRLHKLGLPVIVRPKTNVDSAPDDLRSEIHRLNWIDLSDGFKNARLIAALYAAINGRVAQIPAQPPAPRTPYPTNQPYFNDKRNRPKPDRTQIIVALIGAAAVIVAAIIGVGIPLLNANRAPTPTLAATIAINTATTAIANQPTAASVSPTVVTATPSASPTVDFVAAANTFDAQSTMAVKATSLAGTQIFIAGQTATATLWTHTPTPTLTLTPNITASFSVFLTQRAATQVMQGYRNQTATATLWTPTPTFTPTHISTATFISTITPISFTFISTVTPIPSQTSNQWTPQSQTFDGVEMMLVPGGCFEMGSDNGNDDEKPVSKICFDKPFWIDKTDVTQAQFKRLGGTVAHSPAFVGDQRPVESITWFEARDFCAKRGARLPTEAEWEYAARGPDNLIYPWGNRFNDSKVVWKRSASDGTADVGSKPAGASWVGALDMSGNVWQWVSTLYKPYPYSKNDGRESNSDTITYRSLRGGSWSFTDSDSLQAAYRNADFPSFGNPNYGLRCALS
ncbi:MAG: SUMF1/EgtB/PvdO family nonheme iron enzyme [Chloroflexota bacterium]